jgi:hypothetical protein
MALRFHKARHDLLRLALDGLQFARGVRGLLLGIRLALLPENLEHRMGGEQQLLSRAHVFNQAVEGRF